MLKNTPTSYGAITVLIHWLMAVSVIALFFIGLWMVDLDYGSKWYIAAPDLHRSGGVLIFFALIFRFAWRLLNVIPSSEPNIKKWENVSAHLAHWLIYLLIAVISISGYLLSTEDGRPIEVFNWFNLPATVTSFTNQSDLAGDLHYYSAYTLIGLVVLHAFAALKHHFIDRDRTLMKIFGK